MKKIILTIAIILLTSGCSILGKNNTSQPEIIFKTLTDKTYNNLDIEAAYKIIEPYVKKWSDDAVLLAYFSTLPDKTLDFQSYRFDFISYKKNQGLMLTYNYKQGYQVGEGDINLYDVREQNNHFYFNIINSDKNKKISLNEFNQEIKDEIIDVTKIKITSEKALEIIDKEGFSDFLNKNKGKVILNSFDIIKNGENDYSWFAFYKLEDNGVDKSFALRIDATTGNIIKKTIK